MRSRRRLAIGLLPAAHRDIAICTARAAATMRPTAPRDGHAEGEVAIRIDARCAQWATKVRVARGLHPRGGAPGGTASYMADALRGWRLVCSRRIRAGLVGLYAGLVGLYAGLVGLYAGLVGLYAGLVGLYAGLVGLYAGLVGLYAGLVGLYAGLVGLYAGLVGLYAGDVGL